MVDEHIKTYVKAKLKEGKTRQQIEEILGVMGLTKEEITDAFKDEHLFSSNSPDSGENFVTSLEKGPETRSSLKDNQTRPFGSKVLSLEELSKGEPKPEPEDLPIIGTTVEAKEQPLPEPTRKTEPIPKLVPQDTIGTKPLPTTPQAPVTPKPASPVQIPAIEQMAPTPTVPSPEPPRQPATPSIPAAKPVPVQPASPMIPPSTIPPSTTPLPSQPLIARPAPPKKVPPVQPEPQQPQPEPMNLAPQPTPVQPTPIQPTLTQPMPQTPMKPATQPVQQKPTTIMQQLIEARSQPKPVKPAVTTHPLTQPTPEPIVQPEPQEVPPGDIMEKPPVVLNEDQKLPRMSNQKPEMTKPLVESSSSQALPSSEETYESPANDNPIEELIEEERGTKLGAVIEDFGGLSEIPKTQEPQRPKTKLMSVTPTKPFTGLIQQEKPQKSNKIIPLLVILIAIVAIGGGVYFFMPGLFSPTDPGPVQPVIPKPVYLTKDISAYCNPSEGSVRVTNQADTEIVPKDVEMTILVDGEHYSVDSSDPIAPSEYSTYTSNAMGFPLSAGVRGVVYGKDLTIANFTC